MNNGLLWSGFQTFPVPIGFSFDFMGRSFSTVDLEATGRLIFDPDHFYFADMFVLQGPMDKGIVNSLSPLSYQLTGGGNNRILKIEVNNATLAHDFTATLNYQIWLYEGSNTLELHIGPTVITNPNTTFPSGAFSGVFHVNSFSTNLTSLSPANPPQVEVFPNPVTQAVQVRFAAPSPLPREIELYDAQGALLASFSGAAPQVAIDLSTYAAGSYFIAVREAQSARTMRMVIKQ